MFEIKGKSAVIIGGGRGIGAAVSVALAEEGAAVTIIDTDTVSNPINHYQSVNIDGYKCASSLATKLTATGANITALDVDACNESALTQTLRDIAKDKGAIDILVNAIGSTHIAHTVRSTTSEFFSIIETNLMAPYIACREVAKLMLENKTDGSIINVSSISGKMGFPGVPAYCAAKSGLIGFTISLALEVADQNIRVNAVCPGIVKTNMWKYLEAKMIEQHETSEQFWLRMLEMIPQRRVQEPEDIAHFVVSIIQNTAITGQALSIDGGWNRYG